MEHREAVHGPVPPPQRACTPGCERQPQLESSGARSPSACSRIGVACPPGSRGVCGNGCAPARCNASLPWAHQAPAHSRATSHAEGVTHAARSPADRRSRFRGRHWSSLAMRAFKRRGFSDLVPARRRRTFDAEPQNDESPGYQGFRAKRLKGLEPSTFCMASRRSSQLSYSRAKGRSLAKRRRATN